jgi:glycosyltransferase involved in cell wall biosynthesis
VKISAVLVSFNEESNIAAALESVSWADEIIVVDSQSTDLTRKIAADLGARVIERDWPGFSEQKQFGVDAALNDWILSIDADERVSEELGKEIQGLNLDDREYAGYYIPRLSTYMGREIRHSGWYPDRQLRLFDRRRAGWNGRLIHESVKLSAGESAGALQNNLLHFSVENAAAHHKRIGERYAPLAAQHMYGSGRRTTPFNVATAGPAAFVRSYFLKLGILDGFPGFCIARFAAHHAYLKHLLLWELQNDSGSKKAGDSTTNITP